MATHMAQITIPAVSQLAEDVVVNTWAFEISSWSASVGDSIQLALAGFYGRWQAYLGASTDPQGTTIKVYNLAQPKPRVPLMDELLGLTEANGADSLPREVALCMSFRGPRQSGVNPRRTRGRVYLGPLATSAQDASGARPHQLLIDLIQQAGAQLLSDSSQVATWNWIVHSRIGVGPGQFDATVTYGWVDNEFDIQRRRGLRGTTRTSFGVA